MTETHVVFGAGSLGNAVARQLVSRGHQVKVASRRARPGPTGTSAVAVDASKPSDVEKACAGAVAVYVCAAPPYTSWASEFAPLQAGLIAAIGVAGARYVSAENVYVYGANMAPMTEETAWKPCSKKGAIKAKLNEELLDAHAKGKVKAVLGRAPDYFGPEAVETTVYGGRVFYNAINGKACDLFGNLDALHSMIYVDDFARGLVTLGANASSLGQVWHLPCPPALTQRAMVELIAKAAGQPAKARTLPGPIFAILALAVPIMKELREMEYQWKSTFDFRSDKFQRAFPDVKPTPHDVAFAETVAWFRAHPPART